METSKTQKMDQMNITNYLLLLLKDVHPASKKQKTADLSFFSGATSASPTYVFTALLNIWWKM